MERIVVTTVEPFLVSVEALWTTEPVSVVEPEFEVPTSPLDYVKLAREICGGYAEAALPESVHPAQRYRLHALETIQPD